MSGVASFFISFSRHITNGGPVLNGGRNEIFLITLQRFPRSLFLSGCFFYNVSKLSLGVKTESKTSVPQPRPPPLSSICLLKLQAFVIVFQREAPFPLRPLAYSFFFSRTSNLLFNL